jgi:YD repeat-containing protein
MRCQSWRIPSFFAVLVLVLPLAQAQTAVYHLHKEPSGINSNFDQLKTTGPDASSTALTKALANQVAGDYVIKEFETQTSIPNAPGVIPSGSTMSFSLFMRKTASPSGVTVKPEAKLRLNSATGTSLCSVIGGTALTTTVTKMTFTCQTATAITMMASDRFYLWVGVNISNKSTSTYSGELDIEGTLNGNFDSTITVKIPSAGLTPTSLSFANQIVNTTSASQAVTLKNNQTTSLTISSIAASGDYAQTNNCGTSLAAGASCTINVTFKPTATGTRTGTLTVTDNGNDSPQTASLSGTGIALTSISVTPANPSVPNGLQQSFTATGTYSDNSQQNLTSTVSWSSSSLTIATINSAGVASTLAQGSTTIKAMSGAISGSTTLTVTAPVLQSIAVTPPNPSVALGLTEPFTATGNYSDHSQQNLTSTVTWSSSSLTIATINSAGVASTLAQGSTTIKAMSGAISGSTTLTVTAPVLQSITVTPPNPSVALGLTEPFTAMGNYSDNSQQNLTNTVSWSSSSLTIATINSAGVASTLAQGSTTIKAMSGAISGSTTLTVTAPVLQSITVTPPNPSVALGLTEPFTAMGNYSDNTQQNVTSAVTWSSSALTIATVNSSGVASTLAQGSTTITATSGSINGSATLTVTAPTLVSLSISPTNPSVLKGATQQFTATGTYTDNSTQNLTNSATWSSSMTSVATINTSGLAATLVQGTSTITATSGSVNNSTVLTVVLASPGPSIATLSAPQAAVGDTITITGSNFGFSQGISFVTFNGVSSGICTTPSCWSSSSITVTVPAGATTGNVVVNVNGVNSNGVNLTILPRPLITGMTPLWVPVGGAMTLNGSNFGTSGVVTINGTAVATTSWSATAVGFILPANTPTTTLTTAVVSIGSVSSVPFQFNSHPVPQVNANPGGVCLTQSASGSCITQGAIGAPVTIFGNSFGQIQGDASVTFGGVQATQVNQVGGVLLSAVIPSGVTPGSVNVAVIVDGVSSNLVGFTVMAPPAITSVVGTSGSSGPEGSSVTINGSGFGSAPGTVSFNNTLATVTGANWSDGLITTTVPVGAWTGPVVVNANGAASNGITFTVPPSITPPLNPNSGPVNTVVKIIGSGFGSPQGTSTLAFSWGSNQTTAIPTSWGDNAITVPVPSAVPPGSATLTVTVAGTPTSAPFTVIAGPSITSLSASSGAPRSLIGINGSNFGSLQGSSVVRFNGAAAQVCTSNCQVSGCTTSGWSNTCIPAIVPNAATTGVVTVTVSGQVATGPQFTVTSTGSLSGSVTRSSDGTGVNGATVQVLKQGVVQASTTTASGGSYTVASLPANNYDVQASASGLGTAVQNAVAVNAGTTTSGVNFSLSSAGTITGQITQANGGAPINQATVQAYVGSALVSSVNTGSTNTYTIANLNAGTYSVQTSASGYVSQSQSVSLGAGATATQNFALQAPGSSAISYAYDNLGRLIGVTDQAGDTATYNYDAVGNILSIARRSSSQVSLISIEPSSGHVGDTITLTGTGFSSTASQNTVQFTGGSAVASSSTATQIVTTVPSGASTGAVVVNVNGTLSNNVPFTVLTGAGAPTIANVSPLMGVSGTSFTVTGTNFDSVLSNDQLAVNATALTINPSGYSSTNINTSVPANATSGHVSIATPAGTAISSQDFIVPPPNFQTSAVAYSARIPFPSSGPVSTGNVPPSDVAMMLFDAAGGQKANIQMNAVGIACEMLVYAPTQGTTAIYDQFCNTNGAFTGEIALPRTGTYTIVFHNYGQSTTGSVTFTLYSATDFTSAIAYGQSVTAPFNAAGQLGLLTFAATANQHVSVNVLAGLGSACSLSLVGPANQSLQSFAAPTPYHFSPNGDCSTSGNFWDIGYLPALTGVYTIVITPQAGATLPASVSLQLLDSTDTTTPITTLLTSGTPVTASTSVAGQNSQIVFSGTAGQKISLLVTAMSGYMINGQSVPVYLSVIAPDGSQLNFPHQYALLSPNFFFDPRSSNLVLPTTGSYTILIDPGIFLTPNDPKAAAVGSTTFTLYLASDVTASALNAAGLSFGSSVSTPSTPTPAQFAPGQIVTFPFAANVGQSLALEVDDLNNIGCNFTIYDPNNQPLTTFMGVNYQNVPCTPAGVVYDLPDPLPLAGTYTLVVLPAIDTTTPFHTGSFQMTLTNTQDNVYTITPGSQLTVSNTVPRQNDVITFQGRAGQVITLSINTMSYNPPPLNSFTPNLVINGPAGPNSQQIAAGYAGSNFQTGGTIGPVTLPSDGTYTIFITPGGLTGAAVGSTTFTLTSQ